MDNLQLLERCVGEAQKVIDGVRPEQLGDATPCTDFDVRALLNHLTTAAIGIGQGVSTHNIDAAIFSADALGDDPASAFRQAGKDLVASWSEPGVLDRNVLMPFGEVPGPVGLSATAMEVLAHTADAAVATGQEDLVDQDVATQVLALAAAMPLDDFRMPGVFGPEVECDAGAPAHRRLLALLGRQA